MAKWKLTLEYNGAGFYGWQSQADGKGVQDKVEAAIFAINGVFTRLQVAGRTDRGVHALGQVCSFTCEKEWSPWRLVEALNAHLRKSGVAIIDAQIMNDDFDARFCALARQYIYIIQNRRAPLVLNSGLAWRVPYEINMEIMQKGAQILTGTHDFSTFRDSQCQAKSPVKTLDIFDIEKVNTPYGEQIHFNLRAKSFLHRQVRSMVGSLIDVGRGRWNLEDLQNALAAKDRKCCGEVAPPDGLYLKAVEY